MINIKEFSAGAVAAGIKYKNRPDLGIIYSPCPCVTAGVFTRNKVKAAPVIHGMKRLCGGNPYIRAILVNSGNANACTGAEGLAHVERLTGVAESALGLNPGDVLMCSTGVIGQPLPAERMEQAISALAPELNKDGLSDVAGCILTTDTVKKEAVRRFECGGAPLTIYGMAKGSGMIGPDMGPPCATMLAFILTDASVKPGFWQRALERSVEASFNKIIVDGDTSTNDTVLALASGAAGNSVISGGNDAEVLQVHLTEVLQELAKKIVQDGEGATKCVNVLIEGAMDDNEAEKIARTIARSPLVKTAFFGQDPNWGRILAAAGRAGCHLDPERIELLIDDIPIVKNGIGTGSELEAKAKSAMGNREFMAVLRLGLGKGRARITTCDLSTDYVRINADYRT